MNVELTTFIINELSKHQDRNKIIHKVCEQSELNWKEAEQLIKVVETNHKRTITSRQTPLLVFISIGTLLVGIGLLAFNMQTLLAFFQKDTFSQVLSLTSSYYQVLGSITGLSMTLGGLIGLWRAFGDIFPE